MIEIATSWIHKWSQELGDANVRDKDVIAALDKNEDNSEAWNDAIDVI